MQMSILTSSFNSLKYLDQYCLGLKELKDISDKVDITVVFGAISNIYDNNDFQLIQQKLVETCNLAGIKLHFYQGKGENYSETINNLIAQTIGFTENYAIWNDDDFKLPSHLLAQCYTLKKQLFTYGDFYCTNDVVTVIKNYKDDLNIPGLSITPEITYDEVDLNNKNRYFSRFSYGCFIAWKSQLNVRLGVYDSQLTCASDFDWVNRLIFHGVQPVKTPGVAGCFLSAGQGLSTRPNTAGVPEGNLVLNRFLADKFPCIVNYGKKVLWRNL